MNKNELKNIAESLINTFYVAGKESIDLYNKTNTLIEFYVYKKS